MSKELEELKQQIEELRTAKGTNRLSSYGSIATPIVVAIIGGYFALFGEFKEAETDKYEISSVTESAEKSRWLEQSKFAKELMSDFLDSDTTRAKMALELVSHSDPNLGSRLAHIVSQSSQSVVKDFAQEKKYELRDRLIRQLVHDEKQVRWNAAEGLLAHSQDSLLIKNLINFAKKDSDEINKEGGEIWRIYNVTTVILDLVRSKSTIVYHNEKEILEFAIWAKRNDSKTKNLVSEINSRLGQ